MFLMLQSGGHVWQTYPKVKRFWIHNDLIYSLTQVNPQKPLQQVVLGYSVQKAPRHMKRSISFIFIAAQITIMRS